MIIPVSDKNIPVVITKKRRMRNINLRLDFVENTVKVSAPFYASNKHIENFILSKEEWIIKHFKKHFQKRLTHKKPLFKEGDKFFLQGQEYELIVTRHKLKRSKVQLLAMQIEVCISRELTDKEAAAAIKTSLVKFYKNIALIVIQQRVEHFAKLYGFTYKNISIKTLKSRWGSCSREKNVNFNWRLIMAPTPVLDYVVVHEICHLKQMNHSQKFWDLVEIHAPQHKPLKKWLRDHGQLLEF